MKMKWWVLCLSLLSAACSLMTDSWNEGSTEYRSMQIEGEARSFVLHVPRGVKQKRAGLIMAFHGYGMTGLGLQRTSDLDQIAREVEAVIVYPDAASPYWAEDCNCVGADETHGVADTLFVSAMMDRLTAEFGLDPGRRYGVGFSQGGFFVLRLACQMAHRFKAVVGVASAMARPLAQRCEPSGPISVLTVLSQEDEAIPWEGYEMGRFSTLGGEETAHFWGAVNHCSPSPVESDQGGVLRLRYQECAGGVRVELVGPVDGEHSWIISEGIDIRQELISFLGG